MTYNRKHFDLAGEFLQADFLRDMSAEEGL